MNADNDWGIICAWLAREGLLLIIPRRGPPYLAKPVAPPTKIA